jgi:16S rRNA (guanine966-N2)-methyltransferase
MCRVIDDRGLLAPGGRIYLEQDRARPATPLPDRWRLLRDKTAGNVRYLLAEVAD